MPSTGVGKTWNPNRGFGFIEPDDGGSHIEDSSGCGDKGRQRRLRGYGCRSLRRHDGRRYRRFVCAALGANCRLVEGRKEKSTPRWSIVQVAQKEEDCHISCIIQGQEPLPCVPLHQYVPCFEDYAGTTSQGHGGRTRDVPPHGCKLSFLVTGFVKPRNSY